MNTSDWAYRLEMQLFTLNLHFNPPSAPTTNGSVKMKNILWTFIQFEFQPNRNNDFLLLYQFSMFEFILFFVPFGLQNVTESYIHAYHTLFEWYIWYVLLTQNLKRFHWLKNFFFGEIRNVQRKKHKFVFNLQSIHSDETTHQYTQT